MRFVRKTWTFAVGAACGALLVAIGTGLWTRIAETAETAGSPQMTQSLLYSIVGLAVDTEKNAARIEALENRIDDLEHSLDKTPDARP